MIYNIGLYFILQLLVAMNFPIFILSKQMKEGTWEFWLQLTITPDFENYIVSFKS